MTQAHSRDRYQRGSLTIESRAKGSDIWVYRWREPIGRGKTAQRKRIIGTKKECPTQTAAWKVVEALRLDINADGVSKSMLTVRELAEHYKAKELGEGCGKRVKTRETYTQHIDDYIVRRWGDERIAHIKGARVEDWLRSLDKADGTKSKTKAVFSVMFQHAMRYGWAERNPIREVRQSAKRLREPDVLTAEEVSELISRLPNHARAMVVVAAVTGLRRGELVGLKWQDVDFQNAKIHVRRSLVDRTEGEPKTEASKKPIPMEAALAFSLKRWKEQTRYSNQETGFSQARSMWDGLHIGRG